MMKGENNRGNEGRRFAPCRYCGKIVMHFANGTPYAHSDQNRRRGTRCCGSMREPDPGDLADAAGGIP